LSETTPLYGAKRKRLALTMLQLSHGWHMRNPCTSGGTRLRRSSATQEPARRDITNQKCLRST